MAPHKRSRGLDDIDGEVEIESASSRFRQQKFPKRSRVALARENGGSVVSDDDEENNGDQEQDAYDNGTAQQYSEEEDEDDEVDELRATQIVQKQIREHRDNLASEQGVIEEVFCRNFMCHAKLRIKLGPLINFIIGHNGSGKSAVLTALTMCLGGKATTTNRGASLKSLIREGEESATLAVKIKNQGDGAYRPEIYGRSITVERHFSRAGTSGFKLKNDMDKTISTKKSDLDDILDFFAFQLDNPINVLTQDMARQFLSNSSSSDKYKFFIRGTQLEMLDGDYKLLEEHLDSMEAKLQNRKQDIESLKQKLDEAESRKKRAEQTQVIQDKIKHLGWMHAWAQVEEQERIRDECDRQVQEAEQKVQEKTENAEHIEGAYEGHNQSYEAAQRTLQDFEDHVKPIEETHATEKETFDRNKKELLELKAQERDIRENIKKARRDVSKLEGEVAKEQSRLAGAQGAEHTARLEKLDELKAATEEKNREQMEHGTAFADLDRQRQDATQALEAGKHPVEQRKTTLQDAEGVLRRLQNSRGNQFAPYRPNIGNLVRAINNETRWRSKPVGPMGQHVRLLKQEWSSPLEKTFGGVLESFIVTCKEDQDLLSQIMKRVNCSSNVFIGDPTPLNTTGKEPAEDVDTILRVLEINNDLVRNALIINQGIDQAVLIPDRNQGQEFMNSTPRPQNVRVTMSFLSDRKKAVRFEFSRMGQSKSTNVDQWNGLPRMQSNIQDQISNQKNTVNQAARDLEEVRTELRRLELDVKTSNEELKRFDRRNRELRTQYQEADDAVQAQQNEIESNRLQDGKLQELENQLEEAKGDMESHGASYQDMVNAKDRLDEVAREIKRRLDAVTTERNQGRAHIAKAKDRLTELEGSRQDALREKNLALQMIDVAKNEQARLEQKRERKQAQVDEFVGLATDVCERRIPVDPDMTPQLLDERIIKLIEDVRRAEREAGGTREDLILAWQEARMEHAEAEASMGSMMKCADVRTTISSLCSFA